jgi:DNA-binding NarL/FixJ family response regulator
MNRKTSVQIGLVDTLGETFLDPKIQYATESISYQQLQKMTRNEYIIYLSRLGLSQHAIGRDLGLSQTHIKRILDKEGKT